MSNLSSVQGVYDAFARGDIPAVLGFLSPDIQWTEAEGFPYGGTYVGPIYAEGGSLSVNDAAPAVGREAITAVAQEFMTAFPHMQVFLDELRLEDDRAFYHWTLTGTNSGPGGTGREVRISGYEVWQIGAAGLIAKSRGKFDTEDYRRQLEAAN